MDNILIWALVAFSLNIAIMYVVIKDAGKKAVYEALIEFEKEKMKYLDSQRKNDGNL